MSKDWRLHSACREEDPEIFFPPDYSGPLREQRVAEAKTICAECPVRVTCLAMALETKWTAGIWGGTTEKERAELRERRDIVSDLEIPDRAWQALTDRGNIRLPDAARIIVAAELRRMADKIDDGESYHILKSRADKLDPPEKTDYGR